jgi:hypothetical protein
MYLFCVALIISIVHLCLILLYGTSKRSYQNFQQFEGQFSFLKAFLSYVKTTAY